MHQLLETDYNVHMKKLRRRSILKNFIRVMSCVVVFCTTYALILPAITMENKTFCGLEEHEHTESCYKNVAHRTLVCSYEELGVHCHGSDCYDGNGQLICDQVDYVIHAHNQDCYDVNGYLICTLEEHSAHIHDDACYGISEDEPALHQHSETCFASEKGNLICATEESEGHEHSSDCYAASEELECTIDENHTHNESCHEYPLACDLSTDIHYHNETCFQRGACLCTISEDHTHDDACYEFVQICSKEERTAHEHDVSCYAAEPVLICTTAEGHVHDSVCYKQSLQCDIQEHSGHTHSDDCYEWTDVAICGKEENQPEPTTPVLICKEPDVETHIHNEACFASIEPEYVLLCTNLSEEHVHNPLCYELDCGLRTHKHSLPCYSDPEADLETRKDWEKAFTDIELTGDWAADVLTVAQTQLGYKESKKNYDVWPDDSVHGYTRYGEWYGIPYGDWCAMFVSFCLNYAEVEGMPHNACVDPWIEELTELKLYHTPDVYNPKPGDLIFYNWDEDEEADHVGFVAEIIPETEFEPARIKALEGNSSNRVQYVTYDLNDEAIIGYSELPENSELYICGYVGHIHNEYCIDQDGVLMCEMGEHVHETVCLAEAPEHTEEETVVVPPVSYCGMEEHTHVDDCYNEDGTLNCGAEEHTHNEVCTIEPTVPTEPVILCDKEEHTHSENCYDADGNVVCMIEEHLHDASCLTEIEVPEEESKVFYCGMEAHAHSDTCFDAESNLVCNAEEHIHSDVCEMEPAVVYYCGREEHTHVDDCYNEDSTLNCGAEEHAHDEVCVTEPTVPAEQVIPCDKEEHIHVETCRDADGNVICMLEEHTHDENCSDIAEEEPTEAPPVFYCGKEEHTHVDDCYNEDGALNCGTEEHAHMEDCVTEATEQVIPCDREAHTHGETCYDADGNVICMLEEHIHDASCLSEIEVPEQESKVFYCDMDAHAHSDTCFDAESNLICNAEEHTHTDACEIEPVVIYYCGREEHAHQNQCYGTEGIMVCALKPHAHSADCLTAPIYLCNLDAHVHGEPCYDVERSLICAVPEHQHTAVCEGYSCGTEKHIHGSGCYHESGTLICRNPEHEHCYLCNYYVCGKVVHAHGHWCYDVNKNLACGQDEHRHDETCLVFNLAYEDQNMTVSAMITGVDMLPEDIELIVVPVTLENAPEQFASMSVAVSEELASSNQCISEATFYDLKLKSGDEFFDLPETAMVTVVMEFKDPVFAGGDSDTKAFVLTPNETTAEEPAVEETDPSLLDSMLDSLEEAVSDLFVKASATELEDSDIDQASSGSDYQASGIQSDGSSLVTFQTNQLPLLALAQTRDASFSTYWERVEALSELKSGEQYIIVSAEGNYALLGTTGDNAVPVQLDPIEGHRKNYIITLNATNVTTSDLLWKFEPGNNKYSITNAGTSQPLYPTSNGLFSSGSCTIEKMDVENCWRIKGSDSYYLQFYPSSTSNIKFTSSNEATTNDNSSTYTGGTKDVTYYNARDLLIFRMLPATSTFEPPANYDSIVTNVGSAEEENPVISKPDDYGSFRDASDGLTGDTSIGDVNGKYYSDIATSQLESYFRKEAWVYCGKTAHTHVASCYNGETLTCTKHTHELACTEYKSNVTPVLIDEGTLIYQMTEKNDGMVRTDKSVIYRDDDYDAFSSYGANTFSVTLSALGQAYPISSKYQVQTPVDVVFVLDCSGSMSSNEVTDNQTRIQAMVQALNGSIKSIMESNPANRVGVVLYSQGTNEVLPLNRYTATGDTYFTVNAEKSKVTLSGYTSRKDFYRVYTSGNLKTESGDTQYQNLGSSTYQGLGTYTQAGIAMGSKVFHDIPISDTTYYQTFADGTIIKTQRQPVFILLSDGEPTYSTSMYTDPLNGVHYGDGIGDLNKVKGIHGFYTILSANHYKRLVGIHYNRPALFFSIGLGLDETNSGTSAAYKKAVLDPSSDYLDPLEDDDSKYGLTSEQLLNLLSSSSGVQYLATNVYWPDDWVGVPHMYEPTMANPFQRYDYADESFFGNYSGQELLNKFNEIIQKSLKSSEYGFVLMENTGVTMHDYIGSGMEIKGTPVLRYGGTNYTNPKVSTTTEVVKDSNNKDVTTTIRTYTYSGSFQDQHIPNDEIVDLSNIVVKITDGLPVEPIYMCGNNSASHTHTAACGIYYTYLCGHHSHRLSCHEGNQLNGKLICDDPHDHSNCTPITTTQKVELIVPDSALPIYMPDLVSSNFYYEALPVRLIYQVGLTSEAQAAVAALADNGGELTFYTNRWGGSQHARSSLFPSDSNPFYYDQTYVDPDTKETVTKPHTYVHHTNYKGGTENSAEYDEDDNITDTEDYSVNCHEGSAELQNEQAKYVYHELGNNGKLVFSVDSIDIPVIKNWSQGTPVSELPEAVELKLYRVTPAADDGNPVGTLVSTKSLTPDADGGWTLTFTGVPTPTDDWYYAVVETPVDDFEAKYSGGDLVTFDVTVDSNTIEVSGVKVTVTGEGSTVAVGLITITNTYQWSYELPKTGGSGTTLYYVLGVSLMVSACALYMMQKKVTKKRGMRV